MPALLHDDRLVTEQIGIALYLLELFPAADVNVPVGSRERGAFLSWLGFWAGEADPAYNARSFYADRLDATTQRDSGRVTARVAGALAASAYLMGDRFTAADLFMSGPFEWDPGLVDGNDAISAWLSRLALRPAALRAAARDQPAEA